MLAADVGQQAYAMQTAPQSICTAKNNKLNTRHI